MIPRYRDSRAQTLAVRALCALFVAAFGALFAVSMLVGAGFVTVWIRMFAAGVGALAVGAIACLVIAYVIERSATVPGVATVSNCQVGGSEARQPDKVAPQTPATPRTGLTSGVVPVVRQSVKSRPVVEGVVVGWTQ